MNSVYNQSSVFQSTSLVCVLCGGGGESLVDTFPVFHNRLSGFGFVVVVLKLLRVIC